MNAAAVLLSLFLLGASASACTQTAAAQQTPNGKQIARDAYAGEMKKEGHDCAGIEQQQPLNACMASTMQNTEGSLNAFYNALRGTLDLPARNSLRDAQKTWLLYRKQTCDAAADRYRGGTLAPFVAASCQLRVTRERMRLLYDLYEIGSEQ